MPAADQFNALCRQAGVEDKSVQIFENDYVAIQVEGEGLDASQRVLELTAPLAMAGIPIFFITTYFCDYVLVPAKARSTVTKTLQQRGFVFSEEAAAYVSQLSPVLTHNGFTEWPPPNLSGESESRPSSAAAPSTPPAKDIPELQIRTFSKLKKKGIKPVVHEGLRLVNCAGSKDNEEGKLDQLKDRLLHSLLSIASAKSSASLDLPMGLQNGGYHTEHDSYRNFLSVTLTAEPVSILIQESMLVDFGDALLGSRSSEDILVPIILDLKELGWSATGIVGGVAGRLSQGLVKANKTLDLDAENEDQVTTPIDISFLSTARTGIVVVKLTELARAMKSLEMGAREVEDHSR